MFERLKSGPQAVGAIARGMPVSRPAVSQHLKVLKEAGLVADRPEGTRRVYYIDPDGLGALRAWLDQFWDQALAAFKAEAETMADNDPAAGHKKDRAYDIYSDHRAGAQECPRQCRPGARLRSLHRRARPLVAAQRNDRQVADESGGHGAALGRALVQLSEDGSQADVGKVLVWEPPQHVRHQLGPQRQLEAGPHMSSEVEVRFVAEPQATLVELEHRKFERMGAEGGAKMRKDVDGGWPRMLEHFKREAEAASA